MTHLAARASHRAASGRLSLLAKLPWWWQCAATFLAQKGLGHWYRCTGTGPEGARPNFYSEVQRVRLVVPSVVGGVERRNSDRVLHCPAVRAHLFARF